MYRFYNNFLIAIFQPRANEAGGMYGKGVIARKYQKNQASTVVMVHVVPLKINIILYKLLQVIKVRVELTANHMGFFEFRLCPNNNKKKVASQKCFDQNVIVNAQSGDPR